jgi:hypothetical protein
MSRGSDMRKAIHAPPGYSLIIADQAQIEARLNAWHSGQLNIILAFANKEDVYKIAASLIYGKPVDKITKDERFVGKVCVAEDTPVLCRRGWVPIQHVTTEDEVWDGENWNRHSGVLNNGLRETMQSCGVWMTPDHLVFTGETWLRADSIEADLNTRRQALAFAAANCSSLDMCCGQPETPSSRSSYAATAGAPSTPSTATIFASSTVRAATLAQNWLQRANAIGFTLKRFLTTTIVDGFLTVWRQLLRAATARRASHGSTTVSAASRFWNSGGRTALLSCDTLKPSQAGTTLLSSLTAETQTAGTNRVIYDLLPALSTPGTNGVLLTSKTKTNVYDLISCGPKSRFVVLGSEGPLIVHNCVLALGYQAGWARFAEMLRIGAFGPPVNISDSLAKDVVTAWRQANSFIVANWKRAQNNARAAFIGKQSIDEGVLTYQGAADNGYTHLPNGTSIRYDSLLHDKNNELSYVAKRRRRKDGSVLELRQKLYGGLITENNIQALGRVIIADNILRITDENKNAQLVMTTHDEVVLCVPSRSANKILRGVQKIMTTPPSWAPNLPLAVDAHVSQSYDK